MDFYEAIIRQSSDAEKQNAALRNVTSPLPLTPEQTVEANGIAKRLGTAPAYNADSLEDARRRMAAEMGVEAVQDPFIRDILADRRFSQLVYDSPEEWSRLGTLDKIMTEWKRGNLQGEQYKAVVARMEASRKIEVDPLKNYGDEEMEEATEGGASFKFLQEWASKKGNPLAVEAENLRRELQSEANKIIRQTTAQISGLQRELSALPENTSAAAMQNMGWGDAFKYMLLNPVDTIVATSVNSAAMQWKDWILAGGSSFLNPLAGVAILGQSSARTEFGATFLDQLQKRGFNLANADDVAKAFRSETIRKEVGMYAMKRAAVVSLFDASSAATMLFGLKPLSAAVRLAQSRGVARALAVDVAKLARRENKFLQTAIQAGSGGAGEYFGSKAVGEESAPADILLEMFSDLATAPAELLALRANTARHVNVRRVKAELAMRKAQVIDRLSRVQEASAADTKGLARRSPEAFGEAVQRAVDGTEMAEATINPADVASFQEELAQSAPEIAKRFAEAAQTGAEVRMATGDLMALRTQNPALADKLLAVSRFGNDAMTLEEARAFAETYEKDLEQKVRNLTEKEVAVRSERMRKDAEIEEATKGLRQQLEAAGLTPEEVENQLAVFGATLENFAEAAGMTPAEYLAANPLTVMAAEQTGTMPSPGTQTYQQNDNPVSGPRGDFTPGAPLGNGSTGLNLIRLFQSKNESTFCHEAAHYWLSTLMNRVSWAIKNAVGASRKVTAGESRLFDLADEVLKFVLPAEIDGKKTAEMTFIERVEAWENLGKADRDNAHERFARGFEAYLWEGHCPVGRLREAFRTVTKFLKKVYADATKLGIQMTPEIVRMYDQLFAAQDAIAKDNQNLADQNLLDDLRKAGATEEDIAGISVLVDVAKETAEAKLRAAMQRDADAIRKLHSKEVIGLRKEYENTRAQRLDEINQRNGYRARRALGKGIEGLNGRLMRLRIDRDSAKNLSEEDRKWLSAHHMLTEKNMPEGVEVYGADAIASLFDYNNATDMVAEMRICTDEAANAEATAYADGEFLDRHGEAYTDENIEKLAARYVHNEASLRVLATQVAALRNRLKDWHVLQRAVKAFVREDVDNMVYARQLPSGRWSVISDTNARYAAERAGQQADKARATGDVNAVANAKQAQLIQSAVVVAINDAREFVKGFQGRCRRTLNSKTIEGEYHEQIRFFFAKMGVTGGKMNPQGKPTWDEFAAKHPLADALMLHLPDRLQNHLKSESRETIPWQSLTIGEIRALDRFFRALATQGRMVRRDNKTTKYRDAASILDAAWKEAETATRKGKRPDSNTDTDKSVLAMIARGARTFLMWHVRFGNLIHSLSGVDGALMKEIIYEANDIDALEKTRIQKLAIRLNQIFDTINASGAYWEKPFMEYAGLKWSRHNLFALALNAGNYSNIDRLQRGNNLTMEQIDYLLSCLTREELEAVNAIWDEFETLRQESSVVCRKLDGVEPDWLPRRAFTVTLQNGDTVNMVGGYVPVNYDAERSAKGSNTQRQIENETTEAFLSAQTIRTYTKDRQKTGVQGMAVQLDTEVVFSGMNEIIHDIYWREFVTNFNRLWNGCHTMEPNPEAGQLDKDGKVQPDMIRVEHKGLRELIHAYYGNDGVGVGESWIKMIAFNGKMPGTQRTDALAMHLRRFVTLAGLGFNVVSAAVQVTGLITAATVISPAYLMNGLSKYMFNRKANRAAVDAISPMMALRSTTRIRELDEVANTILRGRVSTFEKIRRWAFVPMTMVQSIVDYSVFNGAYQMALEQGKDPKQARQFAEQTVIETQGSGSVKDRSQIEVGKVGSLFAAFYSYMGTAFNLGYFNFVSEKDRPKAIARILTIYMFQPCVEEILRSALQPGDDDDKDDDENKLVKATKFVVGNTVSFTLGTTILTREISSAVKGLVTGDSIYGYKGPATTRLLSDSIGFLQQVGQGEPDKALLKATINLLGDVTGVIPSAQANRVVDGVDAFFVEGKTNNPLVFALGYKQQKSKKKKKDESETEEE